VDDRAGPALSVVRGRRTGRVDHVVSAGGDVTVIYAHPALERAGGISALLRCGSHSEPAAGHEAGQAPYTVPG
jgi:hypothetical protein